MRRPFPRAKGYSRRIAAGGEGVGLRRHVICNSDESGGSMSPLASRSRLCHLPSATCSAQTAPRITECLVAGETRSSSAPAHWSSASERNPVVRFFMMLGPGLITGASDDDPSGIGTYAQAGASLGYATLWTGVGDVPADGGRAVHLRQSGSGHAAAAWPACCASITPRRLLYPVVFLLLAANTINAGVDIGAIAAGLNLLDSDSRYSSIVPIIVVRHPRLANLGFLPADRPDLQVADAGPVRLHRLGLLSPGPTSWPSCAARSSRRCRFDAGFAGDARRPPRHDHLAVSLLLAGQPGSGGEKGADAASASGSGKGASDSGVELRRLGREHRHVVLERGDVFHHPGDGRDPVAGRAGPTSRPRPTRRRR